MRHGNLHTFATSHTGVSQKKRLCQMDSTTSNAGTSLVSGIQDISAFLPILGTEQCERHVGEALDGGFLYAAATPLSLFGCLGIVKGSAGILCASVSPRLAQMFADAGFNFEGSIAAMIGRTPRPRATLEARKELTHKENDPAKPGAKKEVQKFIAGQRFLQLLQEQHIDKSQVDLAFDYYRWNWWLSISTAFLACFSITPYIRIIMEDHPSPKSVPAWVYPSMRILGSAISVVVAQMIVQIRVQQLLRMSLDDAQTSQPPRATAYDEEKGNKSPQPTGVLYQHETSWTLVVLQVLISFGIGFTGVGYLGCFTIVQRASPTNTYIWLGIEVALALLRICIWGLNPQWDEKTGVNLKLGLVDVAPTITTGQDYRRYIERDREPFLILNDSRFLDYVVPFTGPVERFSDQDHHIAIYYTLAGSLEDEGSYSNQSKVLLTTVLDLESRDTFVLVHQCPSKFPSASSPLTDNTPNVAGTTVYSATLEIIQDMGYTTARYNTVLDAKHEFRKTKRFLDINKHSKSIADRIGGINRVHGLRLSWGLDDAAELFESAKTTSPQVIPRLKSLLTNLDEEYLKLQQPVHQWREDFYRAQELRVMDCMTSLFKLGPLSNLYHVAEDFVKLNVAMESMLVYESVKFERILLTRTAPNDTASHDFYTYARRLEIRAASDSRNEAATKRTTQILSSLSQPDFIDTVDRIRADQSPWKLAAVARDIEEDTLKKLEAHCERAPTCGSEKFTEIWRLEKEPLQKRLNMWGTYAPGSLNHRLAQAVFAAYPACADDPELIKIMVDRGCTVFDFWSSQNRKDHDELLLSRFSMKPDSGVSLLRCPNRWLPQLIKIAEDNPCILEIDMDAGSSELSAALQKNRHTWEKNTIPTGSDPAWWFSFPTGSSARETAIVTDTTENETTGVLFVKTSQAGIMRVNLWHDIAGRDIQISWRLASIPKPFMKPIEPKEGFQRDSFTVKVPSGGVHRIDITIEGLMLLHRYALRRVWVYPVSQEDVNISESHGIVVQKGN
ncbi:hypothetical protein FB451DRAFT_403061 [Mycena latifolia]|nr:hypothetical protein FB451DRAFT_403061 [Mycena latifolia]